MAVLASQVKAHERTLSFDTTEDNTGVLLSGTRRVTVTNISRSLAERPHSER